MSEINQQQQQTSLFVVLNASIYGEEFINQKKVKDTATKLFGGFFDQQVSLGGYQQGTRSILDLFQERIQALCQANSALTADHTLKLLQDKMFQLEDPAIRLIKHFQTLVQELSRKITVTEGA